MWSDTFRVHSLQNGIQKINAQIKLTKIWILCGDGAEELALYGNPNGVRITAKTVSKWSPDAPATTLHGFFTNMINGV